LYQHLTRGINKATTSSYSDHQHTLDRRPKQSQYTKAIGTNSNTTPEQEGHTLESNDSISMNSTEKVSHQTTNKYPNHQMKNQQHQDHSQRTPATTMNPHSDTHQQVSRSLCHQQHQTPATHTTEAHTTTISYSWLTHIGDPQLIHPHSVILIQPVCLLPLPLSPLVPRWTRLSPSPQSMRPTPLLRYSKPWRKSCPRTPSPTPFVSTAPSLLTTFPTPTPPASSFRVFGASAKASAPLSTPPMPSCHAAFGWS
jgi:hypothetical protein